VLVVGFVIALWCGTANAYVLPGRAVLGRYLQKLGPEERLLIRQKAHIRVKTQGQDAIAVDETVRYRFPGVFRSDTKGGAVERVHLQVDGESLTLIDGKVDPMPRDRFDRYKDLLLHRNPDQLERVLSHYGIHSDICSLGRFQGSVVYVIGAQYPDETTAQLVIDKENFWPTRWILDKGSDPLTRERLEIRYGNWSLVGTAWYPWQVEFYQNGELVKTIEVEKLEVNPPLPKALFEMDRLRSMQEPMERNKPSLENKDSEPDEIQKTIEKFKKIYN